MEIFLSGLLGLSCLQWCPVPAPALQLCPIQLAHHDDPPYLSAVPQILLHYDHIGSLRALTSWPPKPYFRKKHAVEVRYRKQKRIR